MTKIEWVLAVSVIVTGFLAWYTIRYAWWRREVDEKLSVYDVRMDLLRDGMMRIDASIAKVSEDIDKRTAP